MRRLVGHWPSRQLPRDKKYGVRLAQLSTEAAPSDSRSISQHGSSALPLLPSCMCMLGSDARHTYLAYIKTDSTASLPRLICYHSSTLERRTHRLASNRLEPTVAAPLSSLQAGRQAQYSFLTRRCRWTPFGVPGAHDT